MAGELMAPQERMTSRAEQMRVAPPTQIRFSVHTGLTKRNNHDRSLLMIHGEVVLAGRPSFHAYSFRLTPAEPETLAGDSAGTSAVRSIFSGWGTTGTSGRVVGGGVAIMPAGAAATAADGATRDFLSRYATAPISKTIKAIKKSTRPFPPAEPAGAGVAAGAVACSAMGGPTTRTSLGGEAAAAGVLACGAATGAGSTGFCADCAATDGAGCVATSGFGPSCGREVGAAVTTVGAVGAETIAFGSADGLGSAAAPGNRDASIASMRRTPRPRPFQLADQT